MEDEVNIDLEDVETIISNDTIETSPAVDYSSEWLTINSIESADQALDTNVTTLENLIASMRKYIEGLKDTSKTTPPDVDDQTIFRR